MKARILSTILSNLSKILTPIISWHPSGSNYITSYEKSCVCLPPSLDTPLLLKSIIYTEREKDQGSNNLIQRSVKRRGCLLSYGLAEPGRELTQPFIRALYILLYVLHNYCSRNQLLHFGLVRRAFGQTIGDPVTHSNAAASARPRVRPLRPPSSEHDQ